MEKAQRNEKEKNTSWDVAKLNLQSAKRRIEKAHEGVKTSTQTIADSKDQLSKEKEHQKKVDADRKKTAEVAGKARVDLRTGAMSQDGTVLAPEGRGWMGDWSVGVLEGKIVMQSPSGREDHRARREERGRSLYRPRHPIRRAAGYS